MRDRRRGWRDGAVRQAPQAEFRGVAGDGQVADGREREDAAVEPGAVAEDLDMTIHPHPTLSETVMESAAAIFGQSTHIYRPARKTDK